MEPIRLQKLMAQAGLMSRRAAEEEIKRGKVRVNGHVATLGMTVNPDTDTVTYNDITVQMQQKAHVYILLNKPRGYLSSVSDERGRKCVTDLIGDIGARVYPVGRLDMVSEGMLLLTDDGELMNRMIRPAHTVPKVYRVKVAGEVDARHYEILTSALTIDGHKIRPVRVVIGESDASGTVLKMTLTEGRNRQIRKMCQQAGLTVKRLNRISIGELKLDNLPVGKWRYLTDAEVEYLYRATRS